VREIAVGYIGEGLRLTNARARAGRAGEEKRCREGEWQTGSGGAACGEGGTTSHGGDRESSLHNLGADGWDGMAGWQYYYLFYFSGYRCRLFYSGIHQTWRFS
jgi:hypothetical protein